MSEAIIKLNVGGRLFETTETTLKFDGVPNFFTGMLSERTPTLKDEHSAFFIDRDPDYFTVILRFMRTRTLDFNSTGSGIVSKTYLHSLYAEALYYSLDSLAEILLQKMQTPDIEVSDGYQFPRLDGAYVNSSNSKAIVFQSYNDSGEEDNKIMIIEDTKCSDNFFNSESGKIDAFTQAQVAHTAHKVPALWNEKNLVDYSAFFYKYIRRGKYEVSHENRTLFLTLIVPGTGDNLTQNVMSILTSDGNELLVYSGAKGTSEGAFVRFIFTRFGDTPKFG